MGCFASKQAPIWSDYEIGDLIGQGNRSEVRIAKDRKTQSPVAVKIVQVKKKNDLKEIKREIQVLKSLNHPNITKYISDYEDPVPCSNLVKHYICLLCREKDSSPSRKLYIVMELASGGELFDRIVEQEMIRESEARDVTKTILETIKYMHEHGVVHRDLKPENIVYEHRGKDSKLKIVDFGFSTIASDPNKKSQFRTLVGTPMYLAPEVIRIAGGSQSSYGKEVDMWALGVIVYVMLSGKFPFNDESPEEMIRQIREARFYFPPTEWNNVSLVAIDFIKQCLALNPQDRLTAEQALQHPWIIKESDELQDDVATHNLQHYLVRNRWKQVTLVVGAVKQFKQISAERLSKSDTEGFQELVEDPTN